LLNAAPTVSKTKIIIGARVADGQLILSVLDEGKGTVRRIYHISLKPFAAEPTPPGGLDLALPSSTAPVAHGGSVTAVNRCRGVQNCNDDSGRDSATGCAGEVRVNEKATALVIDDEPQIRKLLRILLEQEHYRALESDGGRHGLSEIALRRPDVVLLDLGLPDMDGMAVLKELRQWS
jgi:hypothetical protein